jgi:hypothetical protein
VQSALSGELQVLQQDNAATLTGAIDFNALSSLVSLTHLHLGRSQITGMLSTASLPSEIAELRVSYNQITKGMLSCNTYVGLTVLELVGITGLTGTVCPFSSYSPELSYFVLDGLPLLSGTCDWAGAPNALTTLTMSGLASVTGTIPMTLPSS